MLILSGCDPNRCDHRKAGTRNRIATRLVAVENPDDHADMGIRIGAVASNQRKEAMSPPLAMSWRRAARGLAAYSHTQ